MMQDKEKKQIYFVGSYIVFQHQCSSDQRAEAIKNVKNDSD